MAKKKKEKSEPDYKVCSSCGAHNALDAGECKCGKSRFEPDWVLEKATVNRFFSVQITKPNPSFGKKEPRVTLSKWWPGDRATFHIPTASQWELVKRIIDERLGPILGWGKTESIIKEIASQNDSDDLEEAVDHSNLAFEHPDVLRKLVESIDPTSMSAQDTQELAGVLGDIGDIMTGGSAGFREAFLEVVRKLPKQKKRALEDLNELLKGWELHVVTSVAQHVRGRLQMLDLFEERINDPKTFEITGDNSIHRILERAMWLVDERYWIMHSNRTLLKQIGERMQKEDKKRYGKKRPDFVCGTVGSTLIILELKRPSHVLTVEDLNQLERYVIIADEYFKARSTQAFLVGTSVDQDLERTLKHRSNSFKVLPYANIIDDARNRYREYIDSVE